MNKPLSSWPQTTSLTYDQLKAAFGFRQISHIVDKIELVSERNFHLSSTDCEPVLNLGDVASIPIPQFNSKSVPLPLHFGDVFHMDIVFGTKTAIGGIKYALFLIDRATRYRIILPLKNLTDDITNVFLRLKSTLHMFPKRIITDYDHKLIGSRIQQFLIDHNITCTIEAAPPKRQNQNGLSESNWKTIIKMTRAWIANKLMPSNFWWYALRHAVMVSNYLPIKINTTLTSPYFLVHHRRPGLRNLIPLFSVGYITKYKDGITSRSNIDAHSIRVILIGKGHKSNSLLFYHPPTKKIIASDTYRLDDTLPTGPVFHLEFDGGLHLSKYISFNDLIRPPTFHPEQIVCIANDNRYIQSKVITLPSKDSTIYTLQHLHDLSLHQYEESDIYAENPQSDVSKNNPPISTFPKWIKHESKATLFTTNMSKPKHGYILSHHNEFYFRHGKRGNDPYTHLPDFTNTAHDLIQHKQQFQGHPRYKSLLDGRLTALLSNIIANHISATGLTSEDVPSLLDHPKLNKIDKFIWDSAYAEEYHGLVDIPTWLTITEEQYQAIKHLVPVILPSMAVSTIRYDQEGHPKRAKYRIVVLGNLDPRNWNKSELYAPVINLMQKRLLISLAVKKNRILKQGDVKQAFCRSTLPKDKKYVVRPPAGCIFSKPGTYWLLLQTLYGLKRSARHWFDKATKILSSIGLNPCPNAPCIFSGRILPNLPPLYLGLYVDDFIYFSESDEVEREFQIKLKTHVPVDFMGKVTHFLGHKFIWTQDKQNNTTSCHNSQVAFIDNILHLAGIDPNSTTFPTAPYRSGKPVDSIKHIDLPPDKFIPIQQKYRSIIGSLNWLAQGSRPDIAAISSILAKYQNNPSPGHLYAAEYVIRYLAGTKQLGLSFSTHQHTDIQTYIHFPIKTLTSFTDSNWGPQDASVPKPHQTKDQLDLFKTRSISGHLILLHGPLDWLAARQKSTAQSTAEAEIYSTNECVKDLYLTSAT